MEKMYKRDDLLKKLGWSRDQFNNHFPKMCRFYSIPTWKFKNVTEEKNGDSKKGENEYVFDEVSLELTVFMLKAYMNMPVKRSNHVKDNVTLQDFKDFENSLMENVKAIDHRLLKVGIQSDPHYVLLRTEFKLLKAIEERISIILSMVKDQSMFERVINFENLLDVLNQYIIDTATRNQLIKEEPHNSVSLYPSLDYLIRDLLEARLDILIRDRKIEKMNYEELLDSDEFDQVVKGVINYSNISYDFKKSSKEQYDKIEGIQAKTQAVSASLGNLLKKMDYLDKNEVLEKIYGIIKEAEEKSNHEEEHLAKKLKHAQKNYNV